MTFAVPRLPDVEGSASILLALVGMLLTSRSMSARRALMIVSRVR